MKGYLFMNLYIHIVHLFIAKDAQNKHEQMFK